MIRKIDMILLAIVVLITTSCIKNDIPHPVVELSIAKVEGEGFTQSDIDLATRTVTLAIDEKTDIQHVTITKAELDATIHSITVSKEELLLKAHSTTTLTGTFDLRTPIYTTLSLYQEYDWTIRGVQTIARNFTVAGQVGATVYDLLNRTATAYVSKKADLSHVTVTHLKLAASDISTYSPTLEELSGSSFESVRFVDVTCHGRSERWRLYVLPTDKTVELTRADVGSKTIWLYGEGVEGNAMGFRYRKQGESDWQQIEGHTTGGNFKAQITVEPQTAYEIKAYSGTDESAVKSVTTDEARELPNGGFELWSKEKDIIYPYADLSSAFWGTGNPGAAVANETLTQSGAPRPNSTGKYSANLRSKFANVAGVGKFAAGNLFVGRYDRNEGTNGVLTFGRPYTLRPKALRVWVKYNRGIIDKIKGRPAGSSLAKGDPDNGTIYIALGTWTAAEYGKDADGKMTGTNESPICVDTRDVKTFFKSNGKNVVGYGELILTESVENWTEYTIEIAYPDTSIRPTHLMIVCSASRWGDYFTGSTESEMWVDDFELIY